MDWFNKRFPSSIFKLAFFFCYWFFPIFGRAWQPAQTGVPSDFEGKISGLWQDYQQAKSGGDATAQEQAFEVIKALKTEAGSEIFELGANLFLEEGYSDLAKKDYDGARREFLHAADLNPYLWPAYGGLAQIKKERDGQFSRYLYLNFKGFRYAFSLENSFFILSSLVWFFTNIFWAMVLISILFSVIMGLKYLKRFFYTTEDALIQRGVKPVYGHLFSLFLLLIPLLLGVNFYLVAASYLVLFFPFLELRERYAAFIALATGFLLPLIMILLSNFNYARTDPLLKVHLNHFYRGNLSQTIEFLKDHPGVGELGNLSLFNMASFQKQRGEFREALATYGNIPKSSRYWEMAKVNQGNIQFLAKEYQEAIKSYEQALEADANFGLALYNLSIVSAKLGKHRLSESYSSRAANYDATIRGKIELHKDSGLGTVLDTTPNPNQRLLKALSGEGNPWVQDWFQNKFLLMPLAVVALLMALSLFHLKIRNLQLLAKTCTKCGRIFSQSDSPESEWCSQCVSIFIQKDDLPSDAKQKKYNEVKRFERNRKWIGVSFALLFPGAKNILGGSPLSGLLILFFWVSLVVFCIWPVETIAYDFMRHVSGPTIATWLLYAVTLVYWFVFGFRSLWQEED